MVSIKVSSTHGAIEGANPPGGSLRGANLYYTDPLTEKTYPTWAVAAVDELVHKVRHMDIWQIVDFCLAIWAKRYPEEHKQFLNDVKQYRATRKNRYSSTDSRVWRELIMIPPLVNYLLNKIASHRIAEYGEDKFKREFSKRYSALRPGEKF